MEAIEIISAVTETPARAAEATSLAQVHAASSDVHACSLLMQSVGSRQMLRAPASYGSDDQGLQQALALLRKHAAKPGNTELAALVQKVAHWTRSCVRHASTRTCLRVQQAGDDKFAKVKDMIKTLLVKLMEEAAAASAESETRRRMTD
eukprot:3015477-Amphidinium_carterae.1